MATVDQPDVSKDDFDCLLTILFTLRAEQIDFKEAAELLGIGGSPTLPPQKAL